MRTLTPLTPSRAQMRCEIVREVESWNPNGHLGRVSVYFYPQVSPYYAESEIVFQISRLTRPNTVENEPLLSVSQVRQEVTPPQSSIRHAQK